MSLLIEALQNAEKTRNGDGSKDLATASDDPSDLTLQPLSEPQLNISPESPQQEVGIESGRESGSSQEQAASIMHANEAPKYTALDWVGDHHMLTFLALTTLFAISYGLYVYIQVANPSMFRSSPAPAPIPIQSAAVAPPMAPEEVPAQISGLPSATAPENTLASAQMADASGNTSVANADQALADQAAINSNAQSPASKPRAITTLAEPAPRSAGNTRPKPAEPRSVPPRRVAIDSEGVEIIEIPTSPTVSVVPQSAKGTGQNISVKQEVEPASQFDALLLQAYEAMQTGEHQEAGALYEQAMAIDSNSIDALLGLAAIAWKQGQTSAASQHYLRVLELEPRNSYGQAGLIALLGNADPIAAESKLKQLIAREPSGFLYFTLGNLYAGERNWSRAQSAYFQAYQYQPNNADYAFNLAVGLEHLGQTQPALQYYRTALELSFAKGRANFDQELAIERVGQLSARVN